MQTSHHETLVVRHAMLERSIENCTSARSTSWFGQWRDQARREFGHCIPGAPALEEVRAWSTSRCSPTSSAHYACSEHDLGRELALMKGGGLFSP
jgi:hypothetical protein